MSIDQLGTVIVAGWYPDPENDSLARWWDGSQWSDATRQRNVPSPAAEPQGPVAAAPAPEPYRERYFSPVPVRTDATLPPIDPYRPLNRRHDSQGFVSMGVKPTIQFHPTRAYTGAVWAIATIPVWTTIAVLALYIGLGDFYTQFLVALTGVVLFVIALAFAIHDHKVMLNSLHPAAASAWWMFLGPMIYLIVRGVHVSRNVGHGWAPLIVYLICSFVPAAAILALGTLYTFFVSLLARM